ncbi:hypothetical protein [Bacillus sp. HMF5848]|uniref:hypothetical protein n=1 Tax=Bacillus sp. HMF5848 TaxID=2495421 RepID=UPI0026D2045E|nr:hypothetical protein [Bacillus sp. HMF5848]
MGCNIDHSVTDVVNKLNQQQPFLPKDLYEKCLIFIRDEVEQEQLNELFHALKKFDLATTSEQAKRIATITNIISGE